MVEHALGFWPTSVAAGFAPAGAGGYETQQAFNEGVVAALPIAAVVLAAGALPALLTPHRATAGALQAATG